MGAHRADGGRLNLLVSALYGAAPASLPVEVVERKGIGHPDTLCDALAEEVTLALSRSYLDRFGFVLHHNVDKILLRGGSARPAFGGGEVTEPIELYVAVRATREHRGVRIPVEQIVDSACRSWPSAHMRALDAERRVRVHCLVRPGSRELVELFERQHRAGAPKLANDTAIGVGFTPFGALERAATTAEKSLRESSAPERGEDVKILGVRVGTRAREITRDHLATIGSLWELLLSSNLAIDGAGGP